MMRGIARLGIVLGLGAVVASPGPVARGGLEAAAQALAVDTARLRVDAAALAADSMEGRAIGTRGEALAARYIAGRLEELGLQPPAGGYEQPFSVRRFALDGERTRLTLEIRGRRHVFEHGHDFVLSFAGRRALRGFDAPLAFVGSTRTLARAAEKLPPVAGQIAVAAASVWDDPEFVSALAARGAQGVILVTVDEGEYELVLRSRGAHRFELAVDGEQLVDLISPVPVVLVGPRVTELLFSGEIPVESQELHARSRAAALEGLLLASHGRLEVVYRQELVVGRNVLALLPPPDSLDTGEAVLLVAHFDGLGIGLPDADGDSIYNGFADNAVGVAALLAMAERLEAARDRLRRTIVVLASSGEERLLLGAQAYLRDPPVSLERTAAVVNLDGLLVRQPPSWYTVNGGLLSTLGHEVAKIARARGVRAVSTPVVARLDHYVFLRAGVPAISLMPSQRGEGGGALPLRAGRSAYHRPSDEYRPGASLAGVAAVAELALDVALHLSTSETRPQWVGHWRP